MAKGISLHIGLNYVDPKHYSGWDGQLIACEFDANDMSLIAKSKGFNATILLRNEATRNKVISNIKNAASTLKSGDIFFLSYSGHGGQTPDMNSEEIDGMDESWCLFDGQLIDDELDNLWSLFSQNVRILVVSDSCHSGTMTKSIRNDNINPLESHRKFMPKEIAATTYYSNKSFYDRILDENKIIKTIEASVKLISGCQDNQFSYDGTFNGAFTGVLKNVWNGGKFKANYYSFHKKIMNLLPSNQTPNYYNTGKLNLEFDNETPFTV